MRAVPSNSPGNRAAKIVRANHIIIAIALAFLAALPALAQSNQVAAFTWTTFVGKSGRGSVDGIGSAAQFGGPAGVVLDTNGNIYATDNPDNEIRMITPAGVVTTIAGYSDTQGTNDGLGSNARFNSPFGITIDSAGNLYVADSYNFAIRKLSLSGTNWSVTTIAGLPGVQGSADGMNSSARFVQPRGIHSDSTGALYVTDAGYSVRKLTPSGTNWIVTTIAGLYNKYGNSDGVGTNASFSELLDVTVDTAGTIYVSDGLDIRRVSPVGANYQVTTISAIGFGFEGIYGLAADGVDTMAVSSSEAIMHFTVSGTTGTITILAGQTNNAGYADGTGTTAQFSGNQGIAVDSAHNIYVADFGNQCIRKSTSAGVVHTLAGLVLLPGNDVDATGGDARLNFPNAVAVDGSGTVYFTEGQGNNTIREISSAGIVSTVAGQDQTTGSTDATGNNARFANPTGIAVTNGVIYVVDAGNATIREITAAGSVSTISGSAGLLGTNDGLGSAARYSNPSDIALDLSGNIYISDRGNRTIRRLKPDIVRFLFFGWISTTIAGMPGSGGIVFVDGTNSAARFVSPQGMAIDANTNIYMVDDDSMVRRISPVGTNWVVTSLASLPNPSRGHASIALDGSGNLYVSRPDAASIIELSPSGTNWVTNTIGGIGDGTTGSRDGAGMVAQFDSPSDLALDGSGNLFVADSQNNTIRKGIFTAFNSANSLDYVHPPPSGSLTITLTPPEANGQWRFPWELSWRNSGQTASNLMTGNYSVEFRSLPGWIALPPSLTLAISNNVFLTNQYLPTSVIPDTNTAGTLTITLGPNPPSGAGWRFLGDTTAFYPSGFSTNLVAGTYLIEFSSVAGRTKPPNSSVQIFPGQPTLLEENYLLATTPPAMVQLPFPVPTNQINDVVNHPFGFDGQLQSDTGYGSGVAVEANVVLTAAHVVFNDQTLSYVSQAYWYFQQEAGLFSPEPQAARGFYLLSGYAAQRTNDLQIYSPDTSTPQSRNLDVAALYFLSPVAGGGFGGYLPSDQSPNQWLSGSALKMLVGYPVDGSIFGNASIVPGLMYQTLPQPYPLTIASDPVANQRVYTAPWFLSYPGNSGGPVYAQFNGYYYPAGVYLGTLFNGSQPYASLVLGIDSAVVNLITNASLLGDNGTNFTGGGVVTVIPNPNVSLANPGYMQWHLGPSSAVLDGAGWKLQGDANFSTATNYTRVITTTNPVVVQFKSVPGWNLPANQSVSVSPGAVTTYSGSYTVSNPTMIATSSGIGISGAVNTTYRIDQTTSPASGIWTPVSTNMITNSGFNLFIPAPGTNQPATYYRAVLMQ
ncbi:MAG TPA: hypothetical protein VH413_02065 [Verrucomicrobiae bacterium]|nr:hypothetical protein [Verrucomicrobiae bacterium]